MLKRLLHWFSAWRKQKQIDKGTYFFDPPASKK